MHALECVDKRREHLLGQHRGFIDDYHAGAGIAGLFGEPIRPVKAS